MNRDRILEDVLTEKAIIPTNRRGVQLLQRCLDGNKIRKVELQSTKILEAPKDFKNRTKIKLKDDCLEVIRYPGGFFIQILSDGHFLFEVFDNQESDEMHTKIKSRSLKDVESYMWREKAEQYFN